MSKILRLRVVTYPLPLSRASARALRTSNRYDAIVFTSKNARTIYISTLKRLGVRPPYARMISVGPRTHLLKKGLSGKHILFPRSALAPHDIVKILRARGTIVRTIALYSAQLPDLTHAQKTLLSEKNTIVDVASPSAVTGLMRQLRGSLRVHVQGLTVHCIGVTTARAARKAGFRRVSIVGVI